MWPRLGPGRAGAGEADRVKTFDSKGVSVDRAGSGPTVPGNNGGSRGRGHPAQLNDLLAQERRLVIPARRSAAWCSSAWCARETLPAGPAHVPYRQDKLIELDAEVPEDALASVAPGDKATVNLPSGDTVEGTVRLISPRIDPLTKLGLVRISLAPHPQLRAGGYARASFSRTGSMVAAVAEKAIQWEASGPRLITIDEDDRVHPVPVKTGTRDADSSPWAGPARQDPGGSGHRRGTAGRRQGKPCWARSTGGRG